MPSRLRIPPLALLPLLALLLVPALAPAARAAVWLAPAQVTGATPPVDVPATETAVAPDGTVIALWLSIEGGGGCCTRVKAALRPPGGAFGPTQTLSPAGYNASRVDVAVEPSGRAIAVWDAAPGAGGNSIVQAARRPPGGAGFGAGVTITNPAVDSRDPSVGVGDDGRTIIAYTRASGGAYVVETTGSQPGGDAILGQTVISAAGNVEAPDVAMDPGSNTVVVWTRDGVAEANARPALANFAPTATTLSAAGATHARVGMDGQGRAVAVWTQGSGAAARVVFSDMPSFATRAWNPPAVASTGEAGSPEIAVSRSGRAVGIWSRLSGGQVFAEGAIYTPGGTFTQQKGLSNPAGGTFSADVAIGRTGDAVLVWESRVVTAPVIQATRLERDKTDFEPPQTVWTGVGGTANPLVFLSFPSVGVDDAGNAAVTFRRLIFTQNPTPPPTSVYDVFVAGLDAAGPELRGLSIPASGRAGDDVPFSVAPFDPWSPPVSVQWNFGDGSVADGAAVTHRFAEGRQYRVVVTATDAVGNRSQAQQDVVISGGGGGGAGPGGPGGGGVVDRDGDGFPANVDCNDANPAIHPGAREKPGDKVDSNCDGRVDPLPQLLGTVTASWSVRGKRFRLTVLKARNVPAGTRVELRCSGKPKCKFKRKRVKAKVRRGEINILRALKLRAMNLRAGQTLEVRLLRKGYYGKVVRLPLRAGRLPTGRAFCLPQGVDKPQKRC